MGCLTNNLILQTMKKTLLFTTAGVITLLAACTQKEALVEDAFSGKEVVTIVAEIPQTKTTATIKGSEALYSWQDTETISVLEQDATSVKPFTVADAAAGTFSGTKSAGKDLVLAVSPAEVITLAEEDQGAIMYDITLPGSYNNYVAGTTNAVMIGEPKGTSGDNYLFTFKHAAAVAKVTYVNAPAGTAGLSFSTDKNINGTWSFDATSGVTLEIPTTGSKETIISLASPITAPNQTVEFYVPLPVGTYGLFTIYLFDNNLDEIAGTRRSKKVSTTLAKADLFPMPTITLPPTPVYRKVTASSELKEGGQYLIVHEGENPVAFNGGLETLDAIGNTVAVSIVNDIIESSTEVDDAAFTISLENGTILSGSGKYIGVSSNSNGLKQADEATTYINSISINTDGEAVISADFSNSNMTLRYNSASNQNRFRYYGSGQQPVALYLLDGTGTTYVAKAEAGIYYNESDAAKQITLGDSFTAPILNNPNSLDVTYESSNTDVATVVADGDGEGAVTIKAAGVTTITASFAGNDAYKAGTASYTLTVSPSLEIVTVAQFLTKEVNSTAWYQLTGKLTSIDGTNGAKYGNFTLKDSTGEVYVYGLTKTQQASNDQSFGSIGLKEGDIVTINTLRSEHSGNPQAGGTIPAYYVSHKDAPSITASPSSKIVLASVTQVDVTVTATCDWTITGNGFTANPSTGNSGETPVTITFGERTATGDGIITATITADDDSDVKATVTITQHGTDYEQPTGWIATALADIAEGDVFVIVGNNGSNYAMTNDNGASSAPSAVAVSVTNGKLDSSPADNLKWNLTVSSGSYTFYPNGDDSKWLYCLGDNNGVRVGTNTAKTFTISSGYLLHSGTSRYVGVYNSIDWRCYTSINNNIKDQSFTFYKYFDDGKEDAGIAFTPTSATITEGDNFTQPTLNNPHGLTVSYASNNTSVATVTTAGIISVVGVGTAVITASWEEQTISGETYRADSATYTLTVNEDTGSGGGDPVTVTFTPGTDTGETTVTKDGITVAMTTMNNDAYYQVYASQSMTVSSSSHTIVGISFTCTASGTSKYGPGNASANVGQYSYSGSTGTWAGSASSVTISSTAQIRMNSLTITYQ